MKCSVRFFGLAVLLIAFAAAVSHAQVAIGTPPFSSFGGGPFDAVNLGNLNVHFVIPIVQKAGRGLPFNYNLTYDSSIWQPVTSGSTKSWARITNNDWGWTGLIGTGGQIFKNTTTDQETCFVGTLQRTETTTTTSLVTYLDWTGTAHRFLGLAIHKTGCTNQNTGFGPKPALDGSGYQITVDGSGDVTLLTDSKGSTINAVVGSFSTTDTNGNEITSTPSSFTDTLGTTALTTAGSGTQSSPITLSYTSPSGAAASYTVHFTSYTVKTNFLVTGISEYGPTVNSLVSSIQLPDGTAYSFTYEQTPGSCTPITGTFSNCITGRIASVTLPTGGQIIYAYTGGLNGIESDGSTAGLTRVVSPSNPAPSCSSATAPSGCWQYSRTLVSGTPGSGSTWKTTIVDPNGNNTVANFAEDSAGNNLYETQKQVYQGTISASNLLGTAVRCYNANFANCSSATVSSPVTQLDAYSQLPNGSTRLSQLVFNSVGLVTDDEEFDYGVTLGSAPTAAHRIRDTATTYAFFNRPHTIVVSDWTSGSAVTLASSTYTYDQSTPTPASGTTPQHVSVTGSRGNLTTLQTSTSSTASLTRTFTYYDTGTPNVVTDVNGAQTTYVYGTSANPFNSTFTASCGNSFPTTINEPLGLSRSSEWNCIGGVAAQATDENGNNLTAAYTDPDFWRPANVTDQMSNQTNMTYIGATAAEAALQGFNAGHSASDARTTVDGLGRLILSQRLQAPTGSTYDTTETDYNNVGLPSRTTMPFSATAGSTNSTAPGTATTYDAMGRVLTATDNNGGKIAFSYINNDVQQTVTGMQSFQKQSEYDGLGRLSSVCEMTQATGSGTCGQSNQVNGFWTKYTYDALGHLLTVTQNAQAATANQQTRSFTYDMLGRMTLESNPESGTKSYVYDSDSSMCGNGASTQNGDLVKTTDAAGNCVMFYHDTLHRITDIGNSNQSVSHCKRFRYDNSSGYAGSTKPAGLVNTFGRLIEAATDDCSTDDAIITDEWFNYDARGEITDIYESTPHSGGYYHTTAAYWPTGTLKTLSGIPGVPTINYGANGAGLDPEGRITQVTASSGANPVTSVTYSAVSSTNFLGALTGVTFGSADSDSFTYDPNTGRMASYAFSVNGKSDSGTLTWNTNGTLSKFVVSDLIPGTADSQTCNYSYDDLARISNVNCGTFWTQNFTYDSMGNVSKSVPAGDGGLSFQPTYSTTPPTNRFTAIPGVSASYDANGNLLTDNLNTYTWDVYGKMLTVGNLSGTVTLTYDAQGRMVEQKRGSSFSEILYSPAGKTALMNGQGLTKAFIYLPGGATAVYNSTGLAYYRHSDWLGSSRLASTQSRTLYSSSAYAPFGEQYATSGTADASFTGQNMDTVNNLYDFTFRQHSPSQGRWISPDPAGVAVASPSNPQSWNRYAYVNNNPLAAVDPLGLCDYFICVTVLAPYLNDPGGGGGPVVNTPTKALNEGGGGLVLKQALFATYLMIATSPSTCGDLVDGGTGYALQAITGMINSPINSADLNINGMPTSIEIDIAQPVNGLNQPITGANASTNPVDIQTPNGMGAGAQINLDPSGQFFNGYSGRFGLTDQENQMVTLAHEIGHGFNFMGVPNGIITPDGSGGSLGNSQAVVNSCNTDMSSILSTFVGTILQSIP